VAIRSAAQRRRRAERGAPALLALALACGGKPSSPAGPAPPTSTSWSDEFDGAANASPDRSKWTYDLGNNNGWGNQELEAYTSSLDNVRLDGQGHLVIRAVSTPTGFTSARLKTQGLFTMQYGRVEIRAKLPAGQGLWPALWMLGANITTVGWPQCGEIDIMENVGREPGTIHGTVHGPGYSGGNGVSSSFTLPGGQRVFDEFHVYAVQWTASSIAFSVDGTPYATVTPASLRGNAWVFNTPFFLIVNVAVGGTFPGSPDGTTTFPQEMVVDYVRVIPG
jgi:beta-glucanase (GH16 family)